MTQFAVTVAVLLALVAAAAAVPPFFNLQWVAADSCLAKYAGQYACVGGGTPPCTAVVPDTSCNYVLKVDCSAPESGASDASGGRCLNLKATVRLPTYVNIPNQTNLLSYVQCTNIDGGVTGCGTCSVDRVANAFTCMTKDGLELNALSVSQQSIRFSVPIAVLPNAPTGTQLPMVLDTSSTTYSYRMTSTTAVVAATGTVPTTLARTFSNLATLSLVLASPASIVAGRTAVYSVVVSNSYFSDIWLSTDTPASDGKLALLSISLPKSTEFSSASGLTCATAADDAAGNPRVTCNVAVAATKKVSLSLTVSFPPDYALATPAALSATITNQNTLGTGAGPVSAQSVNVAAEVAIALTSNVPATSFAGDTGTVFVKAVNNGPSSGANFNVRVTFPSFYVVSYVPPAVRELEGSCTVVAAVTGAFDCTVANSVLPLNENVQWDFAYTIPSNTLKVSTEVKLEYTVTGGPASRVVTKPVTISAKADLTMSAFAPTQVIAGNGIAFTALVVNKGPSDAAAVDLSWVPGASPTMIVDAALTDSRYLTVVSATYFIAGAASATACTIAATGVTCAPFKLAAATAVRFTFTTEVGSAIASGTLTPSWSLKNTLNAGDAATTVASPAHSIAVKSVSYVSVNSFGTTLAVSQTDSRVVFAVAGQTVEMAPYFKNNGPSVLASATVVTSIPATTGKTDEVTYQDLVTSSSTFKSCVKTTAAGFYTYTCQATNWDMLATASANIKQMPVKLLVDQKARLALRTSTKITTSANVISCGTPVWTGGSDGALSSATSPDLRVASTLLWAANGAATSYSLSADLTVAGSTLSYLYLPEFSIPIFDSIDTDTTDYLELAFTLAGTLDCTAGLFRIEWSARAAGSVPSAWSSDLTGVTVLFNDVAAPAANANGRGWCAAAAASTAGVAWRIRISKPVQGSPFAGRRLAVRFVVDALMPTIVVPVPLRRAAADLTATVSNLKWTYVCKTSACEWKTLAASLPSATDTKKYTCGPETFVNVLSATRADLSTTAVVWQAVAGTKFVAGTSFDLGYAVTNVGPSSATDVGVSLRTAAGVTCGTGVCTRNFTAANLLTSMTTDSTTVKGTFNVALGCSAVGTINLGLLATAWKEGDGVQQTLASTFVSPGAALTPIVSTVVTMSPAADVQKCKSGNVCDITDVGEVEHGFYFSVSNTGPSSALDVTLVVTLEGASGVPTLVSGTTVVTCACTASVLNVLPCTCPLAAAWTACPSPQGTTLTTQMRLVVPAWTAGTAGKVSHTFKLSGNWGTEQVNDPKNQAFDVSTIINSAWPFATVTVDQQVAGLPITYTFAVKNMGPPSPAPSYAVGNRATTGVSILGRFDPRYTFVSLKTPTKTGVCTVVVGGGEVESQLSCPVDKNAGTFNVAADGSVVNWLLVFNTSSAIVDGDAPLMNLWLTAKENLMGRDCEDDTLGPLSSDSGISYGMRCENDVLQASFAAQFELSVALSADSNILACKSANCAQPGADQQFYIDLSNQGPSDASFTFEFLTPFSSRYTPVAQPDFCTPDPIPSFTTSNVLWGCKPPVLLAGENRRVTITSRIAPEVTGSISAYVELNNYQGTNTGSVYDSQVSFNLYPTSLWGLTINTQQIPGMSIDPASGIYQVPSPATGTELLVPFSLVVYNYGPTDAVSTAISVSFDQEAKIAGTSDWSQNAAWAGAATSEWSDCDEDGTGCKVLTRGTDYSFKEFTGIADKDGAKRYGFTCTVVAPVVAQTEARKRQYTLSWYTRVYGTKTGQLRTYVVAASTSAVVRNSDRSVSALAVGGVDVRLSPIAISPATPIPGGQVSLTFTVTNKLRTPVATGVTVFVKLPTDFAFVAYSTDGSGSSLSCKQDATSNVVSCLISDSLGELTASVTVRANIGASVSGQGKGDPLYWITTAEYNSAPFESTGLSVLATGLPLIIFVGNVDLQLKQKSVSSAIAGAKVTLVTTLSYPDGADSLGVSTEATTVVYTQTITNGATNGATYGTIAATNAAGALPAGTCTVDGLVLTCRVASLAKGASIDISVDISLPVDYPVENGVSTSASVSATAKDMNQLNNVLLINASVRRSSALVPTAVSLTPAAIAGARTSITYTVRNSGPSYAYAVVARIKLDSSLSPLVAAATTASGWSCVASATTDASVVCRKPTLDFASSAIVLPVLVAAGASTTLATTTTVTVNADTYFKADGVNLESTTSAALSIPVAASYNLVVSSGAQPTTMQPGLGRSATMRFAIFNVGPSVARAITFRLTATATAKSWFGTVPVIVSDDSVTCPALVAMPYTCTVSEIAVGGRVSVTLVVEPPFDAGATTFTLTGVVSSTVAGDTTAADDTATASITTESVSSIKVAVAGACPSVIDSLTPTSLAVSGFISNSGPSPAAGVVLTLGVGDTTLAPSSVKLTCPATLSPCPTCDVSGSKATCTFTSPIQVGLVNGVNYQINYKLLNLGTEVATTHAVTSTNDPTSASATPITYKVAVKTPTADLSVTASFQSTPSAGSEVVEVVYVANTASTVAPTVTLKTLAAPPAGLVYVSSSTPVYGGCRLADSGAIVCGLGGLGNVQVDQAIPVYITYMVQPYVAAGTVFTNNWAVDAAITDSNPNNNAAQSASPESVVVSDVYVSLLTSSADGAPVLPGNAVVFSAVAVNAGPADVAELVVTGTFAAGVVVAAAAKITTTADDSTCTVVSASSVRCVLANIGVRDTVRINVPTTVTAAYAAASVAATFAATSVADEDTSNNSRTAVVELLNVADVRVAAVAPAAALTAGLEGTYKLTVRNLGNAPSGAVTITHRAVYPGSVTFGAAGLGCMVSSDKAQLTCSAPAAALVAGAPALESVVTLTPHAGLRGYLLMTSNASVSNSPSSAYNTLVQQALALEAVAALSLSAKASAVSVVGGGTLMLTIDVANAGPSAASGVTVIGKLSKQLHLLASGAGTTPGVCGIDDDGSFSCTLASLDAAQTTSIWARFQSLQTPTSTTVRAAIALSASTEEFASVSATSVDVSLLPAPAVDSQLSVDITSDPEVLVAGGAVTYRVVVTNKGPALVADGVELSVLLSPFLTAGTAPKSPKNATCAELSTLRGGAAAWCRLGPLRANATVELLVPATVSADSEGWVSAIAYASAPDDISPAQDVISHKFEKLQLNGAASLAPLRVATLFVVCSLLSLLLWA